VKTLESLFDGIQGVSDESPTLNKAKFVELMVTSGVRVFKDQSIAISFFEAMDLNGNGSVDKKELLLGLVTLSAGGMEEKLRSKQTPRVTPRTVPPLHSHSRLPCRVQRASECLI
jgi:Ca2+-binding EF-hand superfamily protein